MNLRLARYIDRWAGFGVCLALWALGRLLGGLAGVPRVPALRATTPPDGTAPGRPKRVLGIKFYGLGNIAMILPTLQSVKDETGCEIDFLTLPGNQSLLERSGVVTNLLSVEVGGFGGFLGSVVRLFLDLRRGKYDAVLDFEQFMKLSGIFAFLTGAETRVGFNTEGQARGWLYSHRIAYADTDHMADIFLRVARPLGVVEASAPHVILPVAEAEIAEARELAGAADGERVVAMHVGTGPNYDKIALKRWETDRFAALADHLIESRGVRVVFTGVGEEEGRLVDETLANMKHRDRAGSLCDGLSVVQLIALLRACDFVVSNDTSVMHITGLVATPVVAIFGPTEPRIYGPRGADDVVLYRGLYCSPCLSNYNLKMSRCQTPVCMQSIPVAEVAAAIDDRLPDGAVGSARAGSR